MYCYVLCGEWDFSGTYQGLKWSSVARSLSLFLTHTHTQMTLETWLLTDDFFFLILNCLFKKTKQYCYTSAPGGCSQSTCKSCAVRLTCSHCEKQHVPKTASQWQVSGRASWGRKHFLFPSLPLREVDCYFYSDNIRSLTHCTTGELHFFGLFIFISFFFFRPTPAVYGSCRGGCWTGAAVASHSNAGSKLHLQPVLQLAATPYH